MIVEIPDKNMELEFPDDMDPREIERVIQTQVYGKTAPTSPMPASTAMPLPQFDPVSASLNMFSPEAVGGVAKENAHLVGAMAAGAAPVTLPLRAPLSGFGAAVGGLMRHGAGEVSPQDQALMDLGLPMVTGQTLQDFGTGVTGELAGSGVAKVMSKLVAPAAGKISEGARTFIDWATKNKLPFSPDIVKETLPAQAARMASEYTGVGNLFVNRARKKLEQGAIEVADNIISDLGLPPGVQQATAGAETATKLREFGGGIYKDWNEGISELARQDKFTTVKIETTGEVLKKLIPREDILLDDTMQMLGDKVQSKFGQKSIQYGIDDLAGDVYPGIRKNKPLIAILRRADKNGGALSSGREVGQLFDELKNARNQATPYGKKVIDELKQTILDDLERVEIEGQSNSLGAIRRSADAAWKEMVESPLIRKFMNADVPKRGQPFIRSDRLAYETFLEANSADAVKLKEFLIANGFKDQWDALSASYLEKVFSNSVQDGAFKPDKFLSWYKKHGENAKTVMPEYAGALDEWNTVSSYLKKELERKTSATAGNVLTGGPTLRDTPPVVSLE